MASSSREVRLVAVRGAVTQSLPQRSRGTPDTNASSRRGDDTNSVHPDTMTIWQ
jgi:hypothetical protein